MQLYAILNKKTVANILLIAQIDCILYNTVFFSDLYFSYTYTLVKKSDSLKIKKGILLKMPSNSEVYNTAVRSSGFECEKKRHAKECVKL